MTTTAYWARPITLDDNAEYTPKPILEDYTEPYLDDDDCYLEDDDDDDYGSFDDYDDDDDGREAYFLALIEQEEREFEESRLQAIANRNDENYQQAMRELNEIEKRAIALEEKLANSLKNKKKELTIFHNPGTSGKGNNRLKEDPYYPIYLTYNFDDRQIFKDNATFEILADSVKKDDKIYFEYGTSDQIKDCFLDKRKIYIVLGDDQDKNSALIGLGFKAKKAGCFVHVVHDGIVYQSLESYQINQELQMQDPDITIDSSENFNGKLDPAFLLEIISENNFRGMFNFESEVATGKSTSTQPVVRLSSDIGIHNIAVVHRQSLEGALADDLDIPTIKEYFDQKYKNIPHNRRNKGAVLCLDSIHLVPKYMELEGITENQIAVVNDEVDQGINHLNQSSTAVRNNRSQKIALYKDLVSKCRLFIGLSANIPRHTEQFLASCKPGNITKIKNIAKPFKGLKVIVSNNFIVSKNDIVKKALENKYPIWASIEGADFDSTNNSQNFSDYVVSKGVPENRIVRVTKDSINDPNSIAYKCHLPGYREALYEKCIKDNLLILSEPILQTGVSFSDHPFRYHYSFLTKVGSPIDAKQFVHRVRESYMFGSPLMERHVVIEGSTGLGYSKFKGFTDDTILKHFNYLKDYNDQAYSELGGTLTKKLHSDAANTAYFASNEALKNQCTYHFKDVFLDLLQIAGYELIDFEDHLKKHDYNNLENPDHERLDYYYLTNELTENLTEDKAESKQIKLDNEQLELKEIASSQTITDNQYKDYRKNEKNLNKTQRREKTKYEFIRDTGAKFPINAEYIGKYLDGYFSKLELILLANDKYKDILRLRESLNYERHVDKDGNETVYDRLSKAKVGKIKALKEIGIQDLINDILYKSYGNKPRDCKILTSDPVKLDDSDNLYVAIDPDHPSLKDIADKLKEHENILVSPAKNTSTTIKNLLALFGIEMKTHGRDKKKSKWFITLLNNDFLTYKEYFDQKHKANVIDPDHPVFDILLKMDNGTIDPTTQDFKDIHNGWQQMGDKTELSLTDLQDIGSAKPLFTTPIASQLPLGDINRQARKSEIARISKLEEMSKV